MPAIPGPISREEFRRACAQFATGITVITTLARDGSPHGMTANSFTSVSAEPPLILVCIDLRCSVLHHFQACDHFAVNFLAEHQQLVSVRFAQSCDARFEGVGWAGGETGVPIIEETLGALECRVTERINAGDHIILLGAVMAQRTSPGRPLLYFASSYSRLSDSDLPMS